jgi:hypothetical protein
VTWEEVHVEVLEVKDEDEVVEVRVMENTQNVIGGSLPRAWVALEVGRT